MKRANTILTSLKNINSFLLSRPSPCRLLHFQACNSSLFSPFSPQKSHFSTNISPILDLVLTKQWSNTLETDLSEKFQSTPLNHETVVYVLRQLEGNPKKANDFFNWVCNNHGFKVNSFIYGQMLLILANKDTVKEFWGLCKKMLEEGCDVDENVCNNVWGKFKTAKMLNEISEWEKCLEKMAEKGSKDATVVGVVEVVLGIDSEDELVEKLGEFKDDLSENRILRIFRALEGYPLKALFFFRWLNKHADYTHDVVTYSAILRILKQKKSIKEFWSVIEEMKKAGHDLDIDMYIKAARYFSKNMMVEDLVKIYELAMDGPYKPRSEECALILRDISITEAPDLDLVSRVLKKCELSGNSLSKASYDGVYRCFANSGKFDEAENILDTMRNAGLEPDKITYSHGLFALGKAGKLEEVIKLLKAMEASGCIPNLKTYANLIKGQCSRGQVDDALTCYTMMLEKNLEADPDLLDHLVRGFCSYRKVDKAYSMVTELVDKTQVRPMKSTFNNLIEALLKQREFKKGMDILRLMKKHEYQLTRKPFVVYISKYGKVEDAVKFLEAYRFMTQPTVVTYLHILVSFFKEGRQSEAQDFLDKCPEYIRNHPDITNLFDSPEVGSATA
ncbi:hypothetical protein ACHQM5_011017 [Ranunculus cassubicifolius]